MGRWLGAVLGVALASCSAPTFDPAFVQVTVEAGEGAACTGAATCVFVVGEVDGTQAGVARCEVYDVDDPTGVAPVADSGERSIVPGVEFRWQVPGTGGVPLSDLNPVCEPMIEG